MNLLDANDQPGAYPPSWYAATADPLLPFAPLEGETRADVCVIGAGFTGLSAALSLAESGFDVVLLEAQRVGFGASGRNGGQVGSGQRVGQHELERMMGAEDARHLWDIAEAAKARVKSLIEAHKIDCHWRSGIVHAMWHARDVADAHEEVRHLQEVYSYPDAEALDYDGLRRHVTAPGYAGGSIDHGAGHIHPLRFALGLAKAAADAGVRLYEKTRVETIERGDPVHVKTDQGLVRADHLIVACNGYLGDLVPEVAARVMPINNFIVATEPLEAPEAYLPTGAAVADSRFVVNYYRMSSDGRLLFGGGESYGYRFPRDIGALVRRPLAETFPDLANVPFSHAWGGTLAITMPRLPYLRRVTGNILTASGYSGHGVALATLSGQILAEAVSGQAKSFDVMSRLPVPAFPGGTRFRSPLLVLAMTWYALRDRLGV